MKTPYQNRRDWYTFLNFAKKTNMDDILAFTPFINVNNCDEYNNTALIFGYVLSSIGSPKNMGLIIFCVFVYINFVNSLLVF